MKRYLYYFIILGLSALTACSYTMYLPKGEKLYTGTNIKVESDSLKSSQKKAIRTELETLIRPKPNLSLFGWKPKLFAFNISGKPKKEKGFRHWLKYKVGEPPVLGSSVNFKLNRDILTNRLQNKGYFQTSVSSDTSSSKWHVKATYIVKPGIQYHIKAVQFKTDSSDLGKAVTATFAKTLLKPGNPYNLNAIMGERDRIDQILKEDGFYYFSPENLLIKVDSTLGNHQVNLYMTIKPETPRLAKNRYVIGDITIYPNFSMSKDQNDSIQSEAVLFGGFKVIDKDNTFKPKVFSRSIFFKSGELYNRTAHNLSLNRLISMGAFKLVTNRFVPDEKASVPTLNTFYYLTPLQKKSIRAEILGTTKSNNLMGTELSVSWRNNNTFRGAEQLVIRAYGSFELQMSGTQSSYNTFRLGAESTLSFPQFIIPFLHFNTSNAFVPHTKFTLGAEVLDKPQLYRLKSFRALAGYNWKENIREEHELNPISINFVEPANITAKFEDMIKTNPLLSKTIEQQFIVGSTYSYTYSDQLEINRRNNTYFNGNIDIAGNTLGLIQGANTKDGKKAMLFGVPYSQYAKIDGDFRYYFKTGRHSSLVNRIFAGLGIPLGQSQELPYIKQYYAGGSNSNRAFMSRSVGPGTYHLDDSNLNKYFPDQSGDIKLEFNSEYRTKLYSIVQAAIFVDASNVWLFSENSNKPGSNFTKDFLNELAVGTGFGLRFDLTFLVLRTDLAFPIHKPWLAKGDRWVFNQIDFTSNTWRKDNLVFNLAIGYPF